MGKNTKKRAAGQTGQTSANTGSQLPTPKPESTPLAADQASSSNQETDSLKEPKVVTIQPTPEMAQSADAMQVISANFGNIAKAFDTILSQASWLLSHHESVKIQEEVWTTLISDSTLLTGHS